MHKPITEEAVGKDVVDAQGEKIGIVTAVESGTPKVDPHPGLTDKLKAKLNWEDTDAADYPLKEHAIETVTEDEIRLS